MRKSHAALLLGEDGWVKHSQHGIAYHLEVTKVMFSSGNVTERKRMGALPCQGETIVDLFVGIGYFSVPILKHGGAIWTPFQPHFNTPTNPSEPDFNAGDLH